MVKHIVSFGIVCLVLLMACGAVCQDARQSRFLPDAPSAQAAAFGTTQAHNFSAFEAPSWLKAGADASAWPTQQGVFVFSDRTASHQKDPDALFRKYLYPSSLKQPSGYRAAGEGSLMGRATSAASRTVVTRDAVSGKGRVNTSYLLRTLTSVAKDAASTPYWRRHLGAPFSDFGSTVGNDAGMNLWHEFGPNLQQLMKSHAPAFVSKIEKRIGHN
jgi:hypothetical protein